MTNLDLTVLIVYFIGITAYGLWVARRTKSSDQYFRGGRYPLSLNDAIVKTSVMFSSNPAKLLGIYKTTKERPETGSIEVGKTADLILVEFEENKFSISKSLLQGKVVYKA